MMKGWKMKNSKRVKEILVQLAADDKLPLDMNELDSSLFASIDEEPSVGKWIINDVYHKAKSMGKKLTKEQANDIFGIMEDHFDASTGMSWDTIEYCIRKVI